MEPSRLKFKAAKFEWAKLNLVETMVTDETHNGRCSELCNFIWSKILSNKSNLGCKFA